jgi:hypothetical protein
MSKEQEYQATRADIVRGAREHYEQVSKEAMAWHSAIGHGLDAYEREPALLARLADHERHWRAIADAIGCDGGWGGVDCDVKDPLGNAGRIIAAFRKPPMDSGVSKCGHNRYWTGTYGTCFACANEAVQNERNTAVRLYKMAEAEVVRLKAEIVKKDEALNLAEAALRISCDPKMSQSSFQKYSAALAAIKYALGCDGNHAAPACAHQECWHKEN